MDITFDEMVNDQSLIACEPEVERRALIAPSAHHQRANPLEGVNFVTADTDQINVTFLETGAIDLHERGIDEAQAAELRAQLGTFAEEWNSPEMELYNNYDVAKAKL